MPTPPPTDTTPEPGLTRSEKRRRREKRSLIRNHATLLRSLRYAWPYKGPLVFAILLTVFSSALGAFSFLPLVPVIRLVLSPEEVRAEMMDKREEAEEDDLALEQVRGTAGDEQTASPESFQEKFFYDFEETFPWVGKARIYLSKKKDESLASIYEFLLDRREDAIKVIVVLLILVAVGRAFLEYQSKYQLSKVYMSATQKMKVDLYTACLDLDLAAFQERTSGNLIARLSQDVSKFRSILSTSLTQSIKSPIEILFYFIVLMILSTKITLVTIIALPCIIVPLTLIAKKLRSLTKRDAEEDAYLVDVMQETLQGLQIVKAFTTERREQRRFRRVAKDQLHRQLRRARLGLAAPAIVDVLTMTAMGAVVLAGFYVVTEAREMDTAEFVVYLIILTRFYKPFKGISAGVVKVQKALASADRVFEIIDATPHVKEKEDAEHLPPFERELRFEDVTFRYGTGKAPALDHCSLVVPKGEMVALVGSSGSGKTTVTRLMPRFYDPEEGRVSIDGTDLRDVTFKSLRNQIAIVTQETILFDATIYDNIAYGRTDATVEQVEAAARAANAHDFIVDMEKGYHTRIGERGGQLSGGQRQRLAIARAILRDAPILILDEATSALDNESEALVQDALDHLMRNRTVVVIAHRLSTVRNANRILVMEGGRVVEQGTHDELLSAQGRYAELCQQELRRSRPDADDEDGTSAA